MDVAPSGSMMQRVGQRLGNTIYAPMKGAKETDCCFCYCHMGAGERVIQAICHEKHQFHEACFNNFLEHNANAPHLKLCPICRVPIDESKLIKKILTKGTEAGVEDMFNLPNQKKDPQDIIINENEFALD